MKIKELPRELRPREKAWHYGIESLTDEELLALLIGSGVKGCSAIEIARNLLSSYLTLSTLARASICSLEEQTGLSKTSALKLFATFEFHNRLISPFYQHQYEINDSEDAYFRYRYLENYEQEVLAILMLSKTNKIIKEKVLYKGTEEHIVVEPKEICNELLLSRCKKYILIHNHPNGESYPSDEDKYSTLLIKNESEKIGIKMFDHIIIYHGGYYSFKGSKRVI